MAQRKFAQCLGEFQFEYIGDAKTDDEKCIGKCGFQLVGIHHHGNGHFKMLFLGLQLPEKQKWVVSAPVSVHVWELQIPPLFTSRWVFARVLLIPQEPRRSKGADGENSQLGPASKPWKIPLGVHACLLLTVHLSMSATGVVPAVRALADYTSTFSFPMPDRH